MKGKEASGLMLETEIIQTRLKTKLKTKKIKPSVLWSYLEKKKVLFREQVSGKLNPPGLPPPPWTPTIPHHPPGPFIHSSSCWERCRFSVAAERKGRGRPI